MRKKHGIYASRVKNEQGQGIADNISTFQQMMANDDETDEPSPQNIQSPEKGQSQKKV
jgi:hypothetical protein